MTSEHFSTYRQLDYLLLQQATGTATELADRLDIDRSTVFRYLNELRNLGAEIEYNRKQMTYWYINNFSLQNYFS